MKKPETHITIQLIIYAVLLFLSIKGPAPDDYWQFEWVFQLLFLGLLNLIHLILIRIKLKEELVYRKYLSISSLAFFVVGILSFYIVIGI